MSPTIRLLYAEDNPQDADLTRSHFAEHAPDFELQVVSTGAACLAEIGRSPPDLLLLDHHLPDTDSREMLRRLREKAPAVPVVLVTGAGDENLVLSALRLGAVNYVPKRLNYLESLPGLLRDALVDARRKQGEGGARAPASRRVLYVEHQTMDIDLTLRSLADSAPHLAMDVVHTCSEALARLVPPSVYDLALVDVRMPDQNGLEFLREARARQLHLPPCIMISGVGDEETAIAALRLGAVDYVVKSEGYLDQLSLRIDRAMADAALRESETRSRSVVASMAEGVLLHDAAGRVVQSNAAAERILGLSREQMEWGTAEASTWRAIREDGTPFPGEAHPSRVTLRTGEPARNVTLGVYRPDGSLAWISVNAEPLRSGPGVAPYAVVTTFSDITARKEAEEALRQSRDRLRLALEVANAGVWDWSPGTGEAVWSDRLWELFGLEPGSRKPSLDEWAATVHPEDRAAATAMVRRAAEEGTEFAMEWRVLLPDGATRWLLGRGAPLRDASGAPARLGGIVMDITSRKAAEEVAAESRRLAAVRERDARLLAYFNSPAVGVTVSSPEKRFLEVNDRFCSMLGYSREELTRMTWLELTHPADVASELPQFNRVLAGEIASYSLDKRFIRKDGAAVWTFVSLSSARRGDRSVEYVVAIVNDIGKRKEAEQALAEREAELKAFLDAIPSPVFRKDAGSRWLVGNRALFEVVGKSAEATLGRTDREIYDDPTVAEAVMRNDRRIIASGVPEVFEEKVTTPTGIRTFHSTKAPFRDAGGRVIGIVGSALDITERRRAEDELRASEERFRVLAERSPVGIFQTDAEGRSIFLNPAGRKIVGPSQPVGEEGWQASLHPDDRDRVLQEFADAVAAGKSFESEYRYLHEDERTVVVRGRGAAVRDREGKTTSYVGVMIDVTQLKAMELKLQLASRLAAMGTLVAGVGHEVNNPLAAILADQELVREVVVEVRDRLRTSEPIDREAEARHLDEVLEEIGDAMEGAHRIEQIVKDLVRFARPTEEKGRMRLIEAVHLGLRWLPASVRSAAVVSVEDGGAPDILASPGQIGQVVMNLVTNAVKATRPGEVGVVVVRTGPGSPGMSRVDVVDHGMGIAPAIRDRIFDPFFTTRAVGAGRGTGLGLSICHDIVAKHGGTLTVDSEAGKGSTFRVELPTAPELPTTPTEG